MWIGSEALSRAWEFSTGNAKNWHSSFKGLVLISEGPGECSSYPNYKWNFPVVASSLLCSYFPAAIKGCLRRTRKIYIEMAMVNWDSWLKILLVLDPKARMDQQDDTHLVQNILGWSSGGLYPSVMRCHSPWLSVTSESHQIYFKASPSWGFGPLPMLLSVYRSTISKI